MRHRGRTPRRARTLHWQTSRVTTAHTPHGAPVHPGRLDALDGAQLNACTHAFAPRLGQADDLIASLKQSLDALA
eukprot:scaffold93191_cov72-Phaeocystis_antarctica.AAC.1